MKHNISFFYSLFVFLGGISVTALAITPEIHRIAEQADKLYVAGRYSEAFPLMKRAAEGGDVISMFNLGTMYYEGQGTAKNLGEARRWWQEAANQGDDMAREMLNRLDAKQAASRPRTNQRFTVNGVTFTMVYVEGGTFIMGTTDDGNEANDLEKPAHQVTLSGFSIGQTEVTQELWQSVMASNTCRFTGDLQRPVEKVSWNDCQTFITKLNQMTGHSFRLPTEAEWEYAARGGSKSQGYKYSGSNTVGDVAWYGGNNGNSGSTTHAVGTMSANELGLYDMSGNVWEWCQDWDGSYSAEAQTNPTGPMSGSYRVIRGGSWSSYAGSCRVSYRYDYSPSYAYPDLGLRLAL